MVDLKGAEPQVKEVTPTSGAKVVEPTSPEVKPTSRMYNQKEMDEAVGKGRASTQSQLSLSKAETSKVKAEAAQHKAAAEALEADRQDIQGQLDDLVSKQFADDPEARQAYVSRRGIADEKRKLTKEKAEVKTKLYEAEKLAWSAAMARKADALVKETGVDASELENCETEDEMEVKALKFQRDKEPEKAEEVKAEPQFESNVSSGGSNKKIYKLSELEKTEATISELPEGERKAARQDVLKAFNEGRVLDE